MKKGVFGLVVALAVLIVVLILFSYSFAPWFKAEVRGGFEIGFAPPGNSMGACSDSDYGVYPSTKGTLESDHYNYGENLNIEETCFNSTMVLDYGCDVDNNYTYVHRSYNCTTSCVDGECMGIGEGHMLMADFFVDENLIDVANISENFGGNWNVICEAVQQGGICDVGNIPMIVQSITIISDSGRFKFGESGDAFKPVYDSNGNKLQFLPVKSEDLPASEYTFHIVDKDGGWYNGEVQNVKAYIEDDIIKLNYSSMLPGKGHGFNFEVIGDYLQMSVDLMEGSVTVPVLYKESGIFVGVGMNSSDELATSTGNELSYTKVNGDKWFMISRSVGGFEGSGGSQCLANIIANATDCIEGDKREVYYLSDDSCAVDIPGNWTYDRCDYDDNGFIGIKDDVDVDFDLDIYLDGDELNLSIQFNESMEVEFDDEGDLRVKFDFDFDSDTLDLTNIYLRKQNSNDDYGYLIVNGLDGEDKTVYIDKISNSSDSVCVKESAITSIGSISDDCDSSNEKLVKCNGSNSSGYVCQTSGGDYKITGLENSAVMEFEEGERTSSSCSPIWSCTTWGSCINGVETRVCTDANNCGTNVGKLNESQSCTTVTSNSESRTCSELNGDVCAGDEVCSVGLTNAKDGGCCLGVCQSEVVDSGAYFWIVFIILILAIVVVIVMIVLSLRQKSLDKSLGKFRV